VVQWAQRASNSRVDGRASRTPRRQPKAALAANKRCISAAGANRNGFGEEIAETRQLYDHPRRAARWRIFSGKSKT